MRVAYTDATVEDIMEEEEYQTLSKDEVKTINDIINEKLNAGVDPSPPKSSHICKWFLM